MKTIYLLKHRDAYGFVRAIDGATGQVFMAFTNRKIAEAEAARQNDLYGLDCEAVGFNVTKAEGGAS